MSELAEVERSFAVPLLSVRNVTNFMAGWAVMWVWYLLHGLPMR